MITPAYGLTATERVLPSFTLDWTTGLAQSTVDVTRAGVATFVGSNGLIQSAAENAQRVDYSTGVSGLLVEESRTNLLPYSIPDAAVPTGFTTVVNSGTFSHTLETGFGALAGFQQVIRHEQTVSGRSPLNIAMTLAANTTYTLTLFVDKQNSEITSGNEVIMRATGFVDATGTINGLLSDVDSNNKLTITFTTATDNVGNIQIGIGCQNVATGTVIFGGWQLEAGAFPTSYIPTEATAVTRNADVATMTGTNFSDWFNASEGTFAAEVVSNAITGTGELIFGVLQDAANYMRFGRRVAGSTSTNIFAISYVSSTQAYIGSGPISAGVPYKTCFGYKQDNFNISVNGGAVVNDNAGNVPATPTQAQIGSNAGALALNGYIRKLYYYPMQLTSAETQAFSK